MKRRQFLRTVGLGLAMGGVVALPAVSRTARAQAFPSRPITFVVPYAPGGSTDIVARTVAEPMAATLGQTITVENVTGGGSTIGTGRVARAAPDGLTVLVHQTALAVNVTAYPKLPFNAEKDLTSVGLINSSPLILLARKTLQANTLSELVSSMKQNDIQVKLALASGIGSLTHLMTIVFETSVNVHVDIIPYRGAPPALTDILAGHVDVTWAPPELAVEQIRSGAAKGLAITSSERLATIPTVPSVVEMGYDSLAIRFWQGLFAPSRTPDAIIRRLNEALQIALADPKVHRQIEEIGTSIYPKEEQTPEAATALLNSEIKRWGDIIRANKIELSP